MGRQIIEEWACDYCGDRIDTTTADTEWLDASSYGVAFHRQCLGEQTPLILKIMDTEVSLRAGAHWSVQVKYLSLAQIRKWTNGHKLTSVYTFADES